MGDVGMPGWLGAVVEQGREAIAAFGADGTLVYANPAAAALLKVDADALMGTSAFALVHPDDLERVAINLVGIADGARPLPGLIRLRRGDGEWALYEIGASQVEVDGSGPLTAVTIRDTAHPDAQWRFLTALSAGADLHDCFAILAGGLSTDVDGPMGIAYDNDAGRQVAGPLGEIDSGLAGVGPDGRIDLTPGMPWTVAARSGHPVTRPVADLPEPWRSRAAARGFAACVVVPVPDPSGVDPALIIQWPPQVAMAELMVEALVRRPRQAITLALDRRDAQRRLEHLAHHDALTGLLNRGRFFASLSELAATGRPYGVLYVDLDRFKPVNDRLGHVVGDHTLVVCARRLERVVADDDLVARLGGDEFAIASPAVDAEELEARAARVVSALGAPIRIGEHVIAVGASVGLALADGSDAPDAVVAAADAALYEAKRAGRSTWRRASGSVLPSREPLASVSPDPPLRAIRTDRTGRSGPAEAPAAT